MRDRIVASLLLLLVSSTPNVVARPRQETATPTTAPAFSLPGRNGKVALADLAGKVVYVDFWASWCGPCRSSFPWLRTMHDRYARKGLAVVAINLDKDRHAAEAFLSEFPSPFLIAFDPAGATADAWKVSAMPSSYLVGPTGTILYTHRGFDPKESDAIEQKIKEALPQ